MRILGLHIRNTKNAGDRWSSPLDYLPFSGHEMIVGDMRSPPACRPDVVVYGGGSITASPDFHRWPNALMIGWGVGHHERVRPWDEAMRAEHLRASRLCDLYFPRDGITGFERAPCASCMHQVFDEMMPEPVHEFVRYSAARRVAVDVPAGAPHMTNEDGTIEQAVRFLASGRTVITSSYHGAYWAGLLGRKVSLVSWGSKFEYLPKMTLKECRDANRAAHAKVLQLINGAAGGSVH